MNLINFIASFVCVSLLLPKLFDLFRKQKQNNVL